MPLPHPQHNDAVDTLGIDGPAPSIKVGKENSLLWKFPGCLYKAGCRACMQTQCITYDKLKLPVIFERSDFMRFTCFRDEGAEMSTFRRQRAACLRDHLLDRTAN